MPQSVQPKEKRAFGWPDGTVRAIIVLLLVVGFMTGVVLGLILAGADGAQAAGSVLGPPAGGGTSYYFMRHKNKEEQS